MHKGLSTAGKIVGFICLVILITSVYYYSGFWTHAYGYNICVLAQAQEVEGLKEDIKIINQKGEGAYRHNLFTIAECVDCVWYDMSTSELKIKYSHKKHILSSLESEVIAHPISAQFIDFGCNCEDCNKPVGCANINEVKKYNLRIEKISNILHVILVEPDYVSTQPCESCSYHKDESECTDEGCYWCKVDHDQCRGNNYVYNPDICVQNEKLCGYTCLDGECGATCTSRADCFPKICERDSCECVDCSTFDESECTDEGCYWCKVDFNGCLVNKHTTKPEECVPYEQACDYQCVAGECGALCSTMGDECAPLVCNQYTCTCEDLE